MSDFNLMLHQYESLLRSHKNLSLKTVFQLLTQKQKQAKSVAIQVTQNLLQKNTWGNLKVENIP